MKDFFILSLLLFLIAPIAAFSQNNVPVNSNNYVVKAQSETNRLKSFLNLNDVQYQKILGINTDYYKKFADLRTSDATTPAIRRQKLDELNKKHEDDLKRAMEAWQFTKYKNHIDSARNRIMAH